jgi:hypothetical protein
MEISIVAVRIITHAIMLSMARRSGSHIPVRSERLETSQPSHPPERASYQM